MKMVKLVRSNKGHYAVLIIDLKDDRVMTEEFYRLEQALEFIGNELNDGGVTVATVDNVAAENET